MGDSTTSPIVDALAAIFPNGIVAIHVAPPAQAQNGAAPNGAAQAGLTRLEIKTALNGGFALPATDAHPETKSQFAADTLRFANQKAGLSSQLAGPPDERSDDLNASFRDLQTRHGELSTQIGAAKLTEDARKAALAAEPGANQVLAQRVTALGAGSFGTGYFGTALQAVQPPKENPGAGVLDRDKARGDIGTGLDTAEAFRKALAGLGTAEAALAGYPKALKDGFEKARPATPGGIAGKGDLATAEAATPKLAPWGKQVEAGQAYVDATTAFGKARTDAKPDTWPAKVVAAADRVRTEADTLAGTAAATGADLAPACNALKAGEATMAAAGRFAVVQARVEAACTTFPKALEDLKLWLGSLIEGVVDEPAPTAATFDTGISDVEKSEAAIPDALAYATAFAAATVRSKKLTAALKPPLSEEMQKATKTVGDTLALAEKDAAGFYYANANIKVKTAEDALDAGVKARATSAATSNRGKQMHAALADAKDKSGQDLATALFLEFGDAGYDAFLQNATGLQKGAVAGTPESGMGPDIAGANLKALGASVGATGLKDLVGALGGTAADGDLVGARNLGSVMRAGMSAGQVGDLHGVYDLAKDPAALKAVFGTAFSGDPQLFGAIVSGGLKGTRAAGTPDTCVTNLKRMTDAFPNKANLRQVVNGLASTDPNTLTMADFPGLAGNDATKMASAMKEERAIRAGMRMDNLVANHFGGDPAKLKAPFFDQIQGHPDAEYNELNRARLAHETWEYLHPDDQAAQPEPVYTPQMDQRYEVLRRTASTHPSKELLIRTAATLQCGVVPPAGAVAGRGVPVPKGQNSGVVSQPDDQAHFEDRHLRSCNPLSGRSLAPESTPPDQPKLNKPTTLWPEGISPDNLKYLLKQAVAAAGKPPGAGWGMSPDEVRNFSDPAGRHRVVTSFGKKDVTVTFPRTIGGQTVPCTISACVGIERTAETVTPHHDDLRKPAPVARPTVNSYRVSQFYPFGGNLDRIEFEAMQTVKAALGKRNWPGGGTP